MPGFFVWLFLHVRLRHSGLDLNYAVNQQNIDNVLIGVDSDLQLNLNIESLKIELPNQIVDNIDSIEVEDIKMLNPSNWN